MTSKLKNIPQSNRELLLRADNCTIAGQYEQAEEHYKKILTLTPSCADAWIGLGVLALQQNQLQAAEEAFRQALESDPSCWTGWTGLALLYNLQGDKEKAFQALEQAKINSLP